MEPDCAATGDGQEQLPEHATVASEPPSYLPASQLLQVEAPASEYVPDTQLLQVEAPASEYLPATTSPSLSAHPQLLPMLVRVTTWHPAGVRSGAWACSGGLERGACLRGMVSSILILIEFGRGRDKTNDTEHQSSAGNLADIPE